MYFTVVCTNLLYWYTVGLPFAAVLLLTWVGSIGAEVYLQSRYSGKKHRRRALTYFSLLFCLTCEAALWTLGEQALSFYIVYHIAAAALVGSLLGKLGYAVMEHIQNKRNPDP